MNWKGIPTWGQVLLAIVWMVLFVVAAFKEASISFMWVFGIVMILSLLILCNGSRIWGMVAGIVLYGLLVLLGILFGIQCFAQDGTAGLCGLETTLYSLYGLILIPLGTLIGAIIGWIALVVRGER